MKYAVLMAFLLATPVALLVAPSQAIEQEADPSAKEAFEAARSLGTAEAWAAFLSRYGTGFYADLARAHIKALAEAGGAKTEAPGQSRTPPPAPLEAGNSARPGPPAPAVAETPVAAEVGAGVPPTDPGQPAVVRGGSFMGFLERFNRYYTDPAWTPARTVYVGPDGKGDGTTRESPRAPGKAIAEARPGTRIVFTRGDYRGCYEFTKENGGTYDAPVVVYAERKEDASPGVLMACCSTGRGACFNLEQADYVAVDGFKFIGGRYGVRAVGAGYEASAHSRGTAVLRCHGHDQSHDPFFSGQADWAVWERNLAHGAKAGDGHGIYLSNGGDWNIVRFNETFDNPHSDFQINADPGSTCKEVGIPYTDARCDAYAGEGEGGQGASDYFLVDANYFHHNPGPGANFTSVRRSLVRNNVFGFNARHNVSFWQETDNPNLGSRENRIVHNLFVTAHRHGVQFVNGSTANLFANNVLLGVQPSKGSVAAAPAAVLMEVDDTVGENAYWGNLYVGGRIEGRRANENETVRADFSADWFTQFPLGPNRNPNDLAPRPGAPFTELGALLPDAPTDRNGVRRTEPAGLGPIAGEGVPARPASGAGSGSSTGASGPPAGPPDRADAPGNGIPRAVTVARTTAMPACTQFVEAGSRGGDGTAAKPRKSIAEAVAAAKAGAVICVAEGTYLEEIKPGEKPFTLAGGFQRGKGFKVRDSAAYVSKAQGKGGSFIRIVDPGPKADQLTAVDGFEITGYSQALFRDYYEPQRFDITNNYIHSNTCSDQTLVGAGFSLTNVSGTISHNVFRGNACGRGGAGAYVDDINTNAVLIANNLIEGSAGTEPDGSHGGGLYLFGKKLTVTGNAFVRNTVTQWGGGLYVGAFTAGKVTTDARMSWNVYVGNRAGNSGGGFFCDEGARCTSEHEVYAGNCGGNILLDGGAGGSGPTLATFDHVTVVGAYDVGCTEPGLGVLVTKDSDVPDSYSFSNALFWGNKSDGDFAAYCDKHCDQAKVIVAHSMVQTAHAKQNMAVTFGAGIIAPADPLFVNPEKGDFHLQSLAGQWTPNGHAPGSASSPALGKGTGPVSGNPKRAGDRNELGAYGNSPEASFVR
ncbi:uncharacterized protein DUF1565 [Methylorubrum extorquens]